MKKVIKNVLVLIISVFVISCGHRSENNHDHSKSEQTSEHHHEGELSLDNGKPWLANPETTTGINNMIELMNSFSDKKNIDAYSTLKNSLESEFNFIFKNCTMKGEAHNQLHNYLLPMKELFDGIGSSDQNTCKTNFDKLNKHLAEYLNYFE
jgi:hypothetical protein